MASPRDLGLASTDLSDTLPILGEGPVVAETCSAPWRKTCKAVASAVAVLAVLGALAACAGQLPEVAPMRAARVPGSLVLQEGAPGRKMPDSASEAVPMEDLEEHTDKKILVKPQGIDDVVTAMGALGLEAHSKELHTKLMNMRLDDVRNTLIVELRTRTTAPKGVPSDYTTFLQLMSDDDLKNAGSLYVILVDFGIRTEDQLKECTGDGMRNILIEEFGVRKRVKPEELQALRDAELISEWYAWAAGSKIIEHIKKLEFDIDQGTITCEEPEVLIEQIFRNPSKQVKEFSFEVSKEVTKKSSFEISGGFEIGRTAEVSGGIPAVMNGRIETNLNLHASITHGNELSFTETFSLKSPVKLEPRSALRKTAKYSVAALDVPFKAVIITANGEEKEVTGTWHGVSASNLVATQEDLPCCD